MEGMEREGKGGREGGREGGRVSKGEEEREKKIMILH